MLNVANFEKETFYEILKIEMDGLISTIKKLSKMTEVIEEPKVLLRVSEVLKASQAEILKALMIPDTFDVPNITTNNINSAVTEEDDNDIAVI